MAWGDQPNHQGYSYVAAEIGRRKWKCGCWEDYEQQLGKLKKDKQKTFSRIKERLAKERHIPCHSPEENIENLALDRAIHIVEEEWEGKENEEEKGMRWKKYRRRAIDDWKHYGE